MNRIDYYKGILNEIRRQAKQACDEKLKNCLATVNRCFEYAFESFQKEFGFEMQYECAGISCLLSFMNDPDNKEYRGYIEEILKKIRKGNECPGLGKENMN